eukprot:m.44439 g.44439  ORF g.44439 m.44439 type:complete len:221 (-) comp10095_c0_seq2:113-775(-)
MIVTVNASWLICEPVCAMLSTQHNPTMFACITTGATDASLADVEARLGMQLPQDLKAILKINDGQDYFEEDDYFRCKFPQAIWDVLLPTDGIVKYHQNMLDWVKELEIDHETETVLNFRVPDGYIMEGDTNRLAYNDHWIPFAIISGERSPGFLFIDMAPGEGAPPGRVLMLGPEEPLQIVAPSLADLYKDILKTVNTPRRQFRIWYQYNSAGREIPSDL